MQLQVDRGAPDHERVLPAPPDAARAVARAGKIAISRERLLCGFDEAVGYTAMAETTTTIEASALARVMISATRAMQEALPTEVPPNFITRSGVEGA
jgi:hypothetical protein